jgi:hypothetical protein
MGDVSLRGTLWVEYLHDIGSTYQSSNRKSSTHTLTESGQIRLDIYNRLPASRGIPEPGDYLIEDPDCTILFC